MIKEMMKYQAVDINKIILKNYYRLGLNETEAMILMHLFSLLDKPKIALAYSQFKGKITLGKEEWHAVLKSLEGKGFLDIVMETSKAGREQECIDISKAFKKIDDLLEADILEDLKKAQQEKTDEIIDIFEDELGRTLAPTEITLAERISKNFSISDVKNAIDEVAKKGRIKVNLVVDELERSSEMNEKVDEKDAEAIMEFYNRINK